MSELNLIGQSFNNLEVIRFTGNTHPKRGKIYECKCKCGNLVDVPTIYIRRKSKYSCGCSRKTRKDKGVKRVEVKRKGTRLYRIWRNMRRRCNNPNSDYYENYGGRGIKVCDEWDDFLVFRKWALENGYQSTLSIDRVDNDGNYEPGNCRWATRTQQANNARSNVVLEYKGQSKTLSEWAECLGITYSSIHHRYSRGWTVEEIVNIPQGKRRKPSQRALRFTYKGESKTLKELSEINGIKPTTIRYRIQNGMSVSEAVTKPTKN